MENSRELTQESRNLSMTLVANLKGFLDFLISRETGGQGSFSFIFYHKTVRARVRDRSKPVGSKRRDERERVKGYGDRDDFISRVGKHSKADFLKPLPSLKPRVRLLASPVFIVLARLEFHNKTLWLLDTRNPNRFGNELAHRKTIVTFWAQHRC